MHSDPAGGGGAGFPGGPPPGDHFHGASTGSAFPGGMLFPGGPDPASGVGGPVMGSTGQPLGNGNYRFPCADGGSTVVHLGGSGN